MGMCFAPDCKHYSEKHTCRFFRFPTDPKVRNTWINLVRRRDRGPSKDSKLCSCHFLNGKKENGPTLFIHNIAKRLDFPSPEKKKRKSKCTETDSLLPETPTPALAGCSSWDDATTETHQQLRVDTELSENSATSCSFSVEASTSAENFFLKEDNERLRLLLIKSTALLSYNHIEDNDEMVVLYTGLPGTQIFNIVYKQIETEEFKYFLGWNVTIISKKDQLLITLMKLRLNVPHKDLAFRFGCSTQCITNIFITLVYIMHKIFFKKLMAVIPSRNKNKTCLPTSFSQFTNCRIILDCTEVQSAIPKSMEKQRLTYSSYKSRNTWKGLIGVAPNGVITYVSELYPGSTSDKAIVKHCDIRNRLTAGDLVLADKGFLIADLLGPGVHLNIPPFLTTPQFSQQQVHLTESIAKARIHVERAIRRMKCFRILHILPVTLLPHASVIFQLIGALTNFQYPLLKEVESKYFSDTE